MQKMSSFPERVGPRILSLKNIDYFLIREYFSGRKNTTLYEQNFDGSAFVNFHCMQTSLETSIRIIFSDD